MCNAKTEFLSGISLWLLLLLVWFAYVPALGGAFHFDDHVNLHGLAEVTSPSRALDFLSSGAGAIGRPLSLASFLLNIGDWPDQPRGFLRVNVLIHLLNGTLLAWLGVRLFRLTTPLWPAPAVAVNTAALWLVIPLLASATLIIVQRMTGLSATFVIAGLLVYLVGLSWECNGRRGASAIQFTGIVLGTLLAVLAKENGVLLPLLALVLEVTVLTPVAALRRTRRIRVGLLALPVLATLAYLAYLVWHDSPAHFQGRDFSLIERLMTQPVVLLDYLRLALLPRPHAFSPFHDDYPVVRALTDHTTALLALGLWLGLLLLALMQRRRWPWFALAIFWFLGAHLLESSAVALELYFEHRNYVPLIGPALFLTWLAWSGPARGLRLAPVLLGSYILVLALTLWQTATLWGQPAVAAEIWAVHHPGSSRAQQFLAQQAVLAGDPDSALRVIERAAADYPRNIDLSLQALQLACAKGQQERARRAAAQLDNRLPTGMFSNAALEATALLTAGLTEPAKAMPCEVLTPELLHAVLDALLANPRYQTSSGLHHLHHQKARLYRDARQFGDTLDHLHRAFVAKPDIETAVMIVGTLVSGGLYQEALDFIAGARLLAPANPIHRVRWTLLLDQLESQLKAKPAIGSG